MRPAGGPKQRPGRRPAAAPQGERQTPKPTTRWAVRGRSSGEEPEDVLRFLRCQTVHPMMVLIPHRGEEQKAAWQGLRERRSVCRVGGEPEPISFAFLSVINPSGLESTLTPSVPATCGYGCMSRKGHPKPLQVLVAGGLSTRVGVESVSAFGALRRWTNSSNP